MTLYTDFNCGIEVPHKHTGMITGSYSIYYYCIELAGWTKELGCENCGVHKKARTESVVVEEIELFVDSLETEVEIKNDNDSHYWLPCVEYRNGRSHKEHVWIVALDTEHSFEERVFCPGNHNQNGAANGG